MLVPLKASPAKSQASRPPEAGIGAIHAALDGDKIAIALGITATSSSPVLALCRTLVDTGHDPATPLEAYRGDTLALRVRSIGEAAELEINARGTGFIARPAVRAAPPIAETDCPGTRHRPGVGI